MQKSSVKQTLSHEISLRQNMGLCYFSLWDSSDILFLNPSFLFPHLTYDSYFIF